MATPMLPTYSFDATVHMLDPSDYILHTILRQFKRESILGFDLEWDQQSPGAATDRVDLIQVGTLHCVVLIYIDNDKTRIPTLLWDLLADEDITKVGVATADDFRRLGAGDRPIRSVVDLSCMARAIDRFPWLLSVGDVTGLGQLTEHYLREILPFKHAAVGTFNRGRWRQPLDEAHELYAARDVHASVRVYRELRRQPGFSSVPSSYYIFDCYQGQQHRVGEPDIPWNYGDPWNASESIWRCVLCECTSHYSDFSPKAPTLAYKAASHFLACRVVFAQKFHMVYGTTYVANPQFDPENLFMVRRGSGSYYCAGCTIPNRSAALKTRELMEDHVIRCSAAFVKTVDYLVSLVGESDVLDLVDTSYPIAALSPACVITDHPVFV